MLTLIERYKSHASEGVALVEPQEKVVDVTLSPAIPFFFWDPKVSTDGKTSISAVVWHLVSRIRLLTHVSLDLSMHVTVTPSHTAGKPDVCSSEPDPQVSRKPIVATPRLQTPDLCLHSHSIDRHLKH